MTTKEGEQMMTVLKRLLLIVVLLVPLAITFFGLQVQTVRVHAQQAMPSGSCNDTVSDDAQLFGNRIVDVVNQAKAVNDSLQADTRVVTVGQNTLAGSSLRDYYYYIQSKCPTWGGSNFVVLVLAKGHEPFLHLGSQFSGKMTAADFEKQVAVDSSSSLGNKIEELSPRIEVLLALIPAVTATQLRGLFETAKEKASTVQERLGNLLSNPDTNPDSKSLQPAYYAQMQRLYQEIYNEAQEPQYLLHAVETAVQRLERNPQEQIDFHQLTTPGLQQEHPRISRPGYSSESTWQGR